MEKSETTSFDSLRSELQSLSKFLLDYKNSNDSSQKKSMGYQENILQEIKNLASQTKTTLNNLKNETVSTTKELVEKILPVSNEKGKKQSDSFLDKLEEIKKPLIENISKFALEKSKQETVDKNMFTVLSNIDLKIREFIRDWRDNTDLYGGFDKEKPEFSLNKKMDAFLERLSVAINGKEKPKEEKPKDEEGGWLGSLLGMVLLGGGAVMVWDWVKKFLQNNPQIQSAVNAVWDNVKNYYNENIKPKIMNGLKTIGDFLWDHKGTIMAIVGGMALLKATPAIMGSVVSAILTKGIPMLASGMLSGFSTIVRGMGSILMSPIGITAALGVAAVYFAKKFGDEAVNFYKNQQVLKLSDVAFNDKIKYKEVEHIKEQGLSPEMEKLQIKLAEIRRQKNDLMGDTILAQTQSETEQNVIGKVTNAIPGFKYLPGISGISSGASLLSAHNKNEKLEKAEEERKKLEQKEKELLQIIQDTDTRNSDTSGKTTNQTKFEPSGNDKVKEEIKQQTQEEKKQEENKKFQEQQIEIFDMGFKGLTEAINNLIETNLQGHAVNAQATIASTPQPKSNIDEIIKSPNVSRQHADFVIHPDYRLHTA